jgi:hypothetical protein
VLIANVSFDQYPAQCTSHPLQELRFSEVRLEKNERVNTVRVALFSRISLPTDDLAEEDTLIDM